MDSVSEGYHADRASLSSAAAAAAAEDAPAALFPSNHGFFCHLYAERHDRELI